MIRSSFSSQALAAAITVCLALVQLAHPAAAARSLHQTSVQLIPTHKNMYGHDVYYQARTQEASSTGNLEFALLLLSCPFLPNPHATLSGLQVPQNPIGTVFLAHGCAHSAADYWPPSSACPNCRGAPLLPRQTLDTCTQLGRCKLLCPPHSRAAHGAGAHQAGVGPWLCCGGCLLCRPHVWMLRLVRDQPTTLNPDSGYT